MTYFLVKMNCLTVYGKGFLISCPISWNPEKKENAEETLDNVGSVPTNNASNQESNPHELDHVIRNNWCLSLLLWLKSRRGREASPHPSFMVNNPTISHTC